MKRLALSAFLSLSLLTNGCAGPKVSDTSEPEPGECTAPMGLPNGYEIVYDLVDVTTEPEQIYFDDAEFSCTLVRSVGGRAADYCGFTVEVFEDFFSFDTREAFGADADGVGDSEGAIITVTYPDQTLEYRITHVSEF